MTTRIIFDAIRKQIQSPAQIALVRRTIAERLRDYSKGLDAELKDRRERLQRTEERIKGLVGFIADGDRSEYVVATLRDLEAQAKAERAGIERGAPRGPRAPAPAEHWTRSPPRCSASTVARARLRRWLKDGEIRVARAAGGSFELRGAVAPLALVECGNKNVASSITCTVVDHQ